MRFSSSFASLILIPLVALAGCTSPAPIAPRPAPPVAAAPPPAPPRPVATSADWRDWPLTPGTWVYRQDARGSIALFGRAGSDAEVTLRCDRDRARIYLSRKGQGATAFTVRTTSLVRSIGALPAGGAPAYLGAELGVRDSVLDAIGFSRGRFVIETAGLPTLVVPAWAETLRVAEDCRG